MRCDGSDDGTRRLWGLISVFIYEFSKLNPGWATLPKVACVLPVSRGPAGRSFCRIELRRRNEWLGFHQTYLHIVSSLVKVLRFCACFHVLWHFPDQERSCKQLWVQNVQLSGQLYQKYPNKTRRKWDSLRLNLFLSTKIRLYLMQIRN